MTTALVTGVAGFIGSSLAETLLARGYNVRGVDTLKTGKERNVERLERYDNFSFTRDDIRDLEQIAKLSNGVEYVFHQAAVPSVPQSIEDPITTTDINCTGTATVLEAARMTDVDTVVIASSSAVYGSNQELPKVETMRPNPESPYALSKYYAEQLAIQYSNFYDIDTVALRYFNVFGPRQDPEGDYAAVIPKFIRLILRDESPIIYGDGEQSRDFVYIDDVVKANILAAETNATSAVVNVARGQKITINELVKRLNNVFGKDVQPIYEDPRPGDVKHSVADLGLARETLGYEPDVGIEEGLERTVEWFK